MIWIVWDVFRKKKETSGDYFLDGRSATWLAIGASIFASNIGSEHLFGLAGTGDSVGMAQAHWEIQGWMILIFGWVSVTVMAGGLALNALLGICGAQGVNG